MTSFFKKKSLNYFLLRANIVIISVLVIFILSNAINKNQRPTCNDCNVILISLDTLGSSHLPCYGYSRNTAPNLCRFAKDNVLFTNSFSNASWTLPSHFSIFTSLYPKHHGVEFANSTLDANIPTLPEILESNGYDTVFIGPTNDPSLPINGGIGKGFSTIKHYEDINTWKDGYRILIENDKKNKSTFLFLHTYWVHSPYLVREYSQEQKRLFTDRNYPQIPLTYQDFASDYSPEFVNYILKQEKIPSTVKDSLKKAKNTNEVVSRFNALPSEDRNTLRNNYYFEQLLKHDPTGKYAESLYDELIYSLDQQLTEIFNLVTKSDLSKNTIIIITSDHGEAFMEHGYLGHQADNLFNTVTGVPLIMYIPGVKNQTINQQIQGIDIVPTLLSLINIKTNTQFDGKDMSRAIFNLPLSFNNNYAISQGLNIDSIQDRKWKLYVLYSNLENNTEMKLYNLEEDKLEKSNVSSKFPAIVEILSKELNQIIYKKD